MAFEIGQRVGDYEVQKLLGVGGMGHVYLVRNIISNRTEAMKVLLPDLTAEPDLATRFISEIRTLAGFDHPNIAQLRTAFQASNQLIMMMEYVEGYTLEQLATQRRMTVDEVAGYVSQALSALSYAHAHGVVHRDIKPANLMVTSHGVVKLMDFGIAKSTTENINHTKPGTTIGSLHYMSPEQVRGGDIDARSDLYSIGIVLYELLAGRRPFEAETTFSILNAQLNTAPQPPIELNPALPQQLNQLILTALAKDPAHRFQTADDFRAALKPFRTAPTPDEMGATVVTSTPPLEATLKQPTPNEWAQVPPPQQQPPAQQQYAAAPPPPAYNAPPQAAANYAYAPPPPANFRPKQSSGNKPLWIGVGAVAAVIAIAALAVGVPRYMKTHAATSATNTATTTPDATVTAQPITAPVTATPETSTIAPVSTSAGTSATAANNTGSPQAPNSRTTGTRGPGPNALVGHTNALVTPLGHSGSGRQDTQAPITRSDNQGSAPAGNSAELEKEEEHLVQVQARANSARRAVGQIRAQQEASGLGLRGDIESAESRLSSYLNAANSDVQRGNSAAAARDLDKADAELAILEKFLGH